MKKFVLIFIISIFSAISFSQEIQFSDSIEISLLTCSPGPEVYAKFGHSGVRVLDKINGYDFVFNWGLFSFNTENFYLKFIKGETDYLLGIQNTSDFLPQYKERNSMVWEHVLNLNTIEKRRLIKQLLDNYKPENREYRYNFVFDNCATRPRDVILNSIDGHIIFQESYQTKTYRHAIGDYIGSDTWLRFGIDLIFGYQADNNMPQLQSMFLPEILKFEVLNARISNSKRSDSRPLIKDSNILVTSEYIENKEDGRWYKPFNLFVIMLIFIILVSAYELILDKRYNTIIDSAILFSTGAVGILVIFLMFFSVHPLVRYNFNILWLNPLNLIAAVLIWFKKFRIQLFFYQLFNLILVALALVSVAISIQTFNQATFVIIAALLIRYSCWIYRTKKRIMRKNKFKVSD